MAAKLIIDGNAVYEIDEECMEFQKKYGKAGKGNKGVEQQLRKTKESEE
ncbi:MAG: hypothetical protein ACRDBO_18655 [Lachnospiraceae bacterium]